MRIILISSASATWIMRFSVEKEKKKTFFMYHLELNLPQKEKNSNKFR